MAIAEETEFKGNPVLSLKNNENDRYPFTFGLKKAQLILQHIEDIERFVEKNAQEEEQPPPPEE
jgi:hypothetical protein